MKLNYCLNKRYSFALYNLKFLFVFNFLAWPNLLFAQAPKISYTASQTYTAGTAIAPIVPTNTGGAVPALIYQQVSTFAGSGSSGSSNGLGTAASFSYPFGVATDASGNIYVADVNNNLIRKITTGGQVSILAGSGSSGSSNGIGSVASFNTPQGIATDASGNVYVADAGNNLIRKIDPSGNVSTLAGSGTGGSTNGKGTAASFYFPTGVAVDASGNVYVADYFNNLIRKIDASGNVSTFAGSGSYGSNNGNGTSASFYRPQGVATDAAGNVYVADAGNNLIRKIDKSGNVSTLAGSGYYGSSDGTGTAASFNNPKAVTIDIAGNVYVADSGNNLIRKIDINSVVTTFAGNGTYGAINGNGLSANFNNPCGVTTDAVGNIYVADYFNNLIRKITTTGFAPISPMLPSGLTFDATTGTISGTPKHASSAVSYTVSAYNLSGSSTATLSIAVSPGTPSISSFSPTTAGTGTAIIILGTGFTGTTKVSFGGTSASSFTIVSDTVITAVVGAGTSGSVGLTTRGSTPSLSGFNYITAPKISYKASQTYTAGTAISALTATNTGGTIPALRYAEVSTFAGNGSQGSSNGTGTAASFSNIGGLALDAAGNIYIADPGNNLIRKIDQTGVVSTYAGNGTYGSSNGTAKTASFYNPVGVATDLAGNVYVADAGNNLIRKIDPSGNVTTLAGNGLSGSTNGNGTAASFYNPTGVATDASGNVYVADANNNRIRKIDPTGNVTTFAGSGSTYNYGPGNDFYYPSSVTTDAYGNVYVADALNNRVRKVTPSGQITTIAGSGSNGHSDGTGTAASFYNPRGVLADAFGNIYVADASNNLLRKIDPTGIVTTVAGNLSVGNNNGIGIAANFNNPVGLTIDASGDIYIADAGNYLVRKITSTGYATVSPALPTGLIFDGTSGTISGTPQHASSVTTYTVSAYNLVGNSTATFSITVSPGPPSVTSFYPTTAGTGTLVAISGTGFTGTTAVSFGGTSAQSFTILSDTLITALVGSGSSGSIKLTTRGKTPSLSGFNYLTAPNISYTASQTYAAGTAISSLSPTNTGGAVPTTNYGQVSNFSGSGTAGLTNGSSTVARFDFPYGVATDALGNVYVADTYNNVIRKIDASGNVTTLAGTGSYGSANGIAISASFSSPMGIASDASGNIYIADTNNNLIRKIDPSGNVTTIAGNGANGYTDGNGTSASFNVPVGVASDAAGNIYVADSYNNRIRKIDINGNVTTFAGTGSYGYYSAGNDFNHPTGVATDLAGNVYVADANNSRIRKISPSGQITTIAGSGNVGSTNGSGVAASFNNPTGVAVDVAGNVYVADEGNQLIRKIDQNGLVTTLAGNTAQSNTNGVGIAASFNNPNSVATDASGNVYVADVRNNIIRKITATGYSTISPNLPAGLNFDASSGTISGTPKHGNIATTYTVSAYNLVGSNTASFSIAVTPGTPSVSLFYPTTAGTGTTVAIIGNGLIGTTAVSFGGTSAQSFTVLSDTLINAVVGAGASGSLTLTTRGSTSTLSGFNYITSPNISYPATQSYTAGTAINPLTPTNTGGSVPANSYTKVITLAGSGYQGSSNGTGTAVSFNYPKGTATDASGNVYVADDGNSIIRKIDQNGVVTTFAGSGFYGSINGNGTAASFNGPKGLATDILGNVYVADSFNNLIRKIDPSGNVTTFAGSGAQGANNGIGLAASFYYPKGVATDLAGNVYVADAGNNLIRKIDPTGMVTTLAGSGNYGSSNGLGTSASFSNPIGIAADASGNIYVADSYNNLIRKIDPSGNVTTLAGSGASGSSNGIGAAASFNNPTAVAIDVAGNVYVADTYNQLIRKIDPSGVVTTIAGNKSQGAINGNGSSTSFNYLQGIAIDGAGYLYIGDTNNNLIRKVSVTGYSTITPTPPNGLNFDATTGTISGTPKHGNPATTYTVSAYNLAGSSTTTFSITVASGPPVISIFTPTTAGSGNTVSILGNGFSGATAISFGGTNAQSFKILSDTVITAVLGAGASGAISITTSLGTTTASGFNYLALPSISYTSPQTLGVSTAITPIVPTNAGGMVPANVFAQVSTSAGSGSYGSTNGNGTAASFNFPYGVAVDASGNIYVADSNNNLIRKIDPSGNVTTFAGSGYSGSSNGNGTAASFNHPAAVATDLGGNVYVADTYNNLIRKIDPSGNVSTLAGNGYYGSTNGVGSVASFYYPRGVATDLAGNVYIADAGNNLIRKIDPTGLVSTFAGSGNYGSNNGSGTSASFYGPSGVATDVAGNVYVADEYNNLIRKIDPTGLVSTLAGSGVSGSLNGKGTAASFNNPYGVATDISGNVYIADSFNNLIREIDPTGQVSALAGSGFQGSTNGTGSAASFYYPFGITTDGAGNVYIADTYNNLIRKISVTGYLMNSTLPNGLSFDSKTGTISGTPKAPSPATNYSITAYNQVGSNNTTLSIVISPQPAISSFSPLTAGVGTSVKILGNYFTGATNVNFGNTAAQSFTVIDDKTITAVVGNGSSGTVSVTTPYGTGTITGFSFIPTPTVTAGGPTTFLSYSSGVTLTASPASGSYTYKWQNNGIDIAGATNSIYVATQTGTYTVTISLNGVSQISAAINVTSVFELPATNYHLSITGETCDGSSNGVIAITADANYNYTAVLTGNGVNTTQKFTTTTTFSNLPIGTYTLTFTVDGQANYSNAYTVTVTQPQPLSVFATVNNTAGNIELNLSGGSVYHIQVNDKTYTTTESSFTVPLEQGNNALQVTTDRECQGIFTKLINPSLITAPYPMPFEGTLNLNLGSSNIATVSVRIYSANTGLQVFTADYQNKSGVLQLDLSKLAKGAYGLQLIINNTKKEFKIIK